jgi:hypothetical protein
MKKFLFSILILLPAILSAQSVPNGNFEDWDITNYDNLTGWFTSNPQSIRSTGKPSAIKTTDSQNGSAIMLETVTDGNDIFPGYFVNTEGDPTEGEGGFPYAAMPTHITGYYKYDLKTGDTALMLVFFKKAGQVISADTFKITGSQSSYTQFSFPLSLSTTADTVIIGVVSSNIFAVMPAQAGSKLYIDNLAFTGTGSMPDITNGDFENWNTASYDKVIDWNSSGEGVARTTDSYKGSYAIALQTRDFGGGNLGSSGITTGNMNNFHGGRPFSNQVDTLIGYYKYNGIGGDSAQVFILFYKNGAPIGGNNIVLGPAASYKLFQIPINLPTTPDTMRIDIFSSFRNPMPNSTLILDEIQLKSAPLVTSLGEEKVLVNANVFPNPASNKIRIIPGTEIKGNNTLNIYNSIGELVLTKQCNTINAENGIEIEIETLKTGIYFYQLNNSDKQVNVNGRFIKN